MNASQAASSTPRESGRSASETDTAAAMRAPSAFRPPVIPWLLFPFVRLGLDLRLAKIACVVFYALSGVILLRYLMSLGMRDSRLPALGATLLLANPAYVSLSGTLHPQTV